jgi:hypothetical protein
MKRKGLVWILILLASLAAVVPVLADAPALGTVYEGDGVPGIDLGFTRAQVEAAYSEPSSCQSVETSGDFAFCSFPVDGGGQVDVRYRGADGGDAANSPYDVAYIIRWHEQVSGWTTTTGVNTTLAKADPDAVIAAYPEAQVTYNMFGGLYSVVDAEQGIEIIWSLDFYSGTTHVSMAIFSPRPPAPQLIQQTHVESIDLTAAKSKGRREIRALVRVQNEVGLAARGATVSATWTFPDGTSQSVQDVTSNSGYAYFELTGRLDRGTYVLTIDDVTLADHVFDRAGSMLSASVKAK